MSKKLYGDGADILVLTETAALHHAARHPLIPFKQNDCNLI